MSRSFDSGTGRKFLFAMVVVAIVAAVFLLSRPVTQAAKTRSDRTESHQDGILNYDIRTDKHAVETIASYRTAAGKNAPEIADARDAMVRGEEKLKQSVPTLKIEYNLDLWIPEVIAPDVRQGRAFLTKATSGNRADTLKSFLNANTELLGARRSQLDQLKVFSDYTNPDGRLSYVELDQQTNGIPVFRGGVKAGFTQQGEIIRVINNFAPDLDEGSLSTDFGDPAEALKLAAGFINSPLAKRPPEGGTPSASGQKVVFGEGDSAPTAEKLYFPTEPGVAVPAWRVLIWQPVNAFYVIVDAKTGTMLWRKNITEDQSQSATYNVYANPNAMVNIANSPFPMSPGTSSPNGVQAAGISRTAVTRIGNEAPYTFNNLGWITDGSNTLDGNNVQAGLDREAPNDGSLNANAIDPGSIPTGSPNRVFNFPINPSVPTNPALNTGDSPIPAGQNSQLCLDEGTNAVPTDFQKAAVTQLFYISNVFHDEVYRVGFTEAARNFQNDNFGRGGLAGDRISAQAQDCSGINNANFSTPADGARPQMQMYLWQGPNPDIDGSLDADVIIHELTHGLSNRLHGNGDGLQLDIARGMGEGWSDFYAHCLLSTPSDPIDGLYTIGAYDTYLYSSVGFNNYYYGIRRFPKAIMAAVGGPLNRPHNPLTFRDIDATTSDISDAAFNPRFNVTADQVHAIGEVWGVALWEIRARMIQRLGWEAGNRRILQFVTDGMKLAPLGPTPISERDAMIAAIFASGTEADLADAWAGFALRGFGANASIQALGGISTGGGGQVRVTESFDLPNLSVVLTSVTDSQGGDGDGYPEPGERVSLNMTVTNATGRNATSVSMSNGNDPTLVIGDISGRASLFVGLGYTIPSGTVCGSVIPVTIQFGSSLGPFTVTKNIFVGKPAATTSAENFDGIASPSLPTGWTAVTVSNGLNFVNSTITPDSAPNVMYARNPTTVGGGTDLTAPPISITSPTATVTFRNNYNTEADWDGGVLEISIQGSDYQDFVTAGGTFVQNGYNGSLSGGRNNPIASRQGWTGNSNGYLTTIAQFPASANGKIVQLRWRFGADDNTAGTGTDPGWRIDDVSLSGAGFVTSFACALTAPTVTISGRVLTPNGIALRNAVVILTDAQSVQRRFTTGSFGIFSFDQIQVGQTYTVSVASKRYRFAPQVLNITGAISNLDLIGLE
ncbi:MAG: M36 family metallopeptidase [Pyrinomonadaceae bacterium]